jgi:hypothetical protein
MNNLTNVQLKNFKTGDVSYTTVTTQSELDVIRANKIYGIMRIYKLNK